MWTFEFADVIKYCAVYVNIDDSEYQFGTSGILYNLKKKFVDFFEKYLK